jgi:hypothetical protein
VSEIFDNEMNKALLKMEKVRSESLERRFKKGRFDIFS